MDLATVDRGMRAMGHGSGQTAAMHDQAETIVGLPRPGGKFGPDAELRLQRKWATSNGAEYLDLRVWERGSGAKSFATNKGTSIRLRELPDLIAALQGVLDASSATAPPAPPRSRRPEPMPRGRRREPVAASAAEIAAPWEVTDPDDDGVF